jgi:hypothetical protein
MFNYRVSQSSIWMLVRNFVQSYSVAIDRMVLDVCQYYIMVLLDLQICSPYTSGKKNWIRMHHQYIRTLYLRWERSVDT